jgi:hypothetical protein
LAPGAASTKCPNADDRLSTAAATAPPGCPRIHSVSAARGSIESDAASRWAPPTSHTTACRPSASAASARTAATVVFPAPPFPVT